MSTAATDAERIEAYVAASRGSKKRALLLALNDGFDFTLAVGAMGDDGVRLSFACLCEGLIDRGTITPAGRAWLEKEMA